MMELSKLQCFDSVYIRRISFRFVGLSYVFLTAMYSNSVNAYNLGNFFVTLGDDVTVRTLRLSVFWERGLLSKERGSVQAYSELKGASPSENYHGE